MTSIKHKDITQIIDDKLGMCIWLAFILVTVIGLQLSIPYPLDDDTAYHYSVAKLMRDHGVLHSFPWTRFSWQFDHYADKEFLFHLLFVPFTPFGFNIASRVVGIIGGTAILSTIYLVLRNEKVRYAGWWALLPLGTTIFVYRFSQVRPHLFSIALAILLLWAYSRRRPVILGLLAVLYPLVYVAFWQIPLILIFAAESARFLARERYFDWRLMLVFAGGLALGVVLHPNAMNLLQMNWIHMIDVLFRNAWGGRVEFNIGEEFEPFRPLDWLEFLLPTAVMVGTALFYAWRYRKVEVVTLSFAFASLAFALLTMRTNRFLEYLVPFSVLSLAMVSGRLGKKWLIPLLVVVSCLYTFASGVPLLKYLAAHDQKIWHLTPHPEFGHFPGMAGLTIHDERTWQMSPEVDAEFERLLPKNADVFTCGWEYTGSMLLNLPERDYMVALDPTLLYKHDPGLYDLWYRTLKEAPANSAEIVRNDFASRYAVCLDHPTLHPFFNALKTDTMTKVLFSDGKWVLFDLEADRDKVVQ
jgi:hypothetical protein